MLRSYLNRPVGWAVMRSSLEREIWGSDLGSVKLDTVLPTARYRHDISSKEAVFPGRNDAEMGNVNSLHASALCSKYNKTFDFAILLCSQNIKKNLCLNSGNRYFCELKTLFAKANGKRSVGQPRTRWINYIEDLRWNRLTFAQVKWWKSVIFGGLISSCCSRNPHGKAGNKKESEREIQFGDLLIFENEYPFLSFKTIKLLTVFSTGWLCKKKIAILTYVESKQNKGIDGYMFHKLCVS